MSDVRRVRAEIQAPETITVHVAPEAELAVEVVGEAEALRLGLSHGYRQEKESAQEIYTPAFDLTGVLKKS